MVDGNKEEIGHKYPFVGMGISDTDILNKIDYRSPCSKCCKSRKYFCYTCCIPIEDLVRKIPNVKLPVKIDIIKHKNEIVGKSTSTHAALLAPNNVVIHQYPDIPDYTLEEDVVLIFPSPQSISISNIFTGHCDFEIEENFGLPKGHHMGTLLRFKLNEVAKSADDQYDANENQFLDYDWTNLPIKRAVFIDSTWNQTRSIYKDPRVNGMTSIVLQHRASQFWRHQKGSPRWYLATIEAIHQFLLEVHINAWGVQKKYLECLKTVEIRTEFIPPYKIVQDKEDSETQQYEDNSIAPYNGQYDDLLFFFKHMYDLIHIYYDHNALKSYKRPFI